MVHYPFDIIFWLLSWLPAGLAIIIARGRAKEPYPNWGIYIIKDKRSDTHAKLNLTTQDKKGKEDGPSGLLEQEKGSPKQEVQKPVRRGRREVSRERQREPGADTPLPDKKSPDSSSALAARKGSLVDHTLPFHTVASNEDIQGYLEDLAKIPPLKAAEEQACLERIAADPDSTEALEARHRLIEGSLSRVVRLARRSQPFGLPLADLIQEGNLALVTAAHRFDPTRSRHFRAFAARAVSWALHRMVEAHLRERHLREIDRGAMAPLGTKTFKALMRHDLDQEAAVFDFPEERFCSLDALLAQRDTDAQLPDEYLTALHDDRSESEAPEPDEGLIAHERSDALAACLENLTRKERQVLLLRFGLIGDHDHTLEEVGRILRVTRETVRQTEARAIRKLRYPSCSRRLRDFL